MDIGVISDTHGLLRPEALQALAGCDRLIHAGDIGKPAILAALAEQAPLDAIRGNNDRADWAADLPETLLLDCDGVRIHVLHDLKTLALDPQAAGVQVVIAGHSHAPACLTRAGVLYLNPGSAGPRRFDRPVALARLRIERGRVRATLLALGAGGWQILADQ